MHDNTRMSERKASALFLQQLHEQEIAIQKEKEQHERELREAEQEKYDSLRYDRRKIQNAYNEFKLFVRDTCLEYAIAGLMETALAKSDLTDRDMNMVSGFVKGFIKEQGGSGFILRKATGKTFVIDSIKEAVEEETEEIVAKADPKNPETFIIDKKDIEKMMDKLDNNDDYNEVKSAIALRVVSAEDNFVNNSIKDKQDIEDVVTSAEEKTEKVKNDPDMSDETKEKITQEIARECKKHITRINETPKSAIFDEMVRRLSVSSMKTNRKHFVLEESGKLDIDRVVNTVKIMYTLMETISTAGIVKIDEQFINETLENL